MAELPSMEEMAKKVAEMALDRVYKGKTIREWIEQILKEQEANNGGRKMD